ncbi:MAG: ribosome maturation factor RimP [Desulfuromonadales bacterium]|jgi:ribosome maturation factor RimP|nr:ribosome maturation factor RimP [Desulfuromonadales bacterium]
MLTFFISGKESFDRMTQQTVLDKVRALVLPVLEEKGCELVDIEYKRESHGCVLRLYIDEPGGVTLDTCVEVSREISVLLEVEDPIETAYNLEVSSPGLDRPLTKAADYERFVGRLAKIKSRVAIDIDGKGRGRKTFVGTLEGLCDGKVLIELKEKNGFRVEVPLEDIEKANLEIEF